MVRRFSPFVNFLSREKPQKRAWIVAQDGVFWPTSKSGSGLGLTSANTGDIDRANRPAFPRAVFPDDVKSSSAKGSSREIVRFLLRSVGALCRDIRFIRVRF
jgi:hypothetical protein